MLGSVTTAILHLLTQQYFVENIYIYICQCDSQKMISKNKKRERLWHTLSNQDWLLQSKTFWQYFEEIAKEMVWTPLNTLTNSLLQWIYFC